jgi:hypothetical protein
MTSRLLDLKHEHLKTLENLCQTDTNYENFKPIYESLANFSNEQKKVNKKILKKTQLDQLNANSKLKLEDKLKINPNLSHCENCKLSYWNETNGLSNFHAYLVPKYHLTYQNAKLYTKLKILNKKLKYKSYQDKIIKNFTENGIKFIYKCKTCGQKNVIFQESKRDLSNFKFPKLKQSKNGKISTSSLITFNSSIKIKQNEPAKRTKSYFKQKKFQNLKLTLENEEKKKEINAKAPSNVGPNLLDFLRQVK